MKHQDPYLAIASSTPSNTSAPIFYNLNYAHD